jgi:hypothetical protein
MLGLRRFEMADPWRFTAFAWLCNGGRLADGVDVNFNMAGGKATQIGEVNQTSIHRRERRDEGEKFDSEAAVRTI